MSALQGKYDEATTNANRFQQEAQAFQQQFISQQQQHSALSATFAASRAASSSTASSSASRSRVGRREEEEEQKGNPHTFSASSSTPAPMLARKLLTQAELNLDVLAKSLHQDRCLQEELKKGWSILVYVAPGLCFFFLLFDSRNHLMSFSSLSLR